MESSMPSSMSAAGASGPPDGPPEGSAGGAPEAAKPGRPKAVSLEAILSAATEIADDRGLDAVSFRVLGDRLGVSPMAIHRTTGGIEALRHTMVSEVVGRVTRSIVWPDDWQGVVRVFAEELRALLMRHPLVLEAHRRAALDAPGADAVAHRVAGVLRTAGLDEERAAYAYAAVHDFVTGHVAIRLGRGELEHYDASPERQAASVFARYHDYAERFRQGLELLITGIESTIAEGRPAGPAGRPRGRA